MAKLPKVSNGAKRCEKVRKYPFLNYESPALAAELQARHALTREHPTFNVQRESLAGAEFSGEISGCPPPLVNLLPNECGFGIGV